MKKYAVNGLLSAFLYMILSALAFSASATTAHLEVGDQVITDDGMNGEVRQVYANGKVQILLANTVVYVIRNKSTLGKSCRCVEDICRNDKVIDSDNISGEVRYVYDNGTVKMTLTNSVTSVIRTFSDLGVTNSCVETNSCTCH